MNISHLPSYGVVHVGICLTFAQLNIGNVLAASAEPPSNTKVTAPKTHTLFMGADIDVEKDKAFFRVEEVSWGSLLVRADGKQEKLPTEQCSNLRVTETLKIADMSAEISDLKSERAYTPGSDPFRKLAAAAALSAGQSAVSDLANGDVMQANRGMMGANIALNAVRGTPNEGMGRAAVAEAEGNQAKAEGNLMQTYAVPSGDIYDLGSQSVRAGNEASQEMFDAIRITFDVKSPKDLEQPYYAVIVQFHELGSKPGHARKWAYVRALNPLSAGESKTVNIYASGLPPGYVIENCEVHLYNHNRELASNLSRKRVPLTSEEAIDFRVIEYVGANKGKTLPATPVRTTLPSEGRAALTHTLLNAPCFIRVAKDGHAIAAFSDAAGKQPLNDPVLQTALKTFRFKPALEAGKPVETIVPLQLGQVPSL